MRLELTRRGDYAIRVMLALSDAGPGWTTARSIAEAMDIPIRMVPHDWRTARWPTSAVRGLRL